MRLSPNLLDLSSNGNASSSSRYWVICFWTLTMIKIVVPGYLFFYRKLPRSKAPMKLLCHMPYWICIIYKTVWISSDPFVSSEPFCGRSSLLLFQQRSTKGFCSIAYYWARVIDWLWHDAKPQPPRGFFGLKKHLPQKSVVALLRIMHYYILENWNVITLPPAASTL
jgi:hypothetical protein